jgi:Dolichyl-phosphate-mannose-protein mannosyltransferase
MNATSRRLSATRAHASRISPWPATIGVVAVVGIAMRVWLYRSALEIPDSDEALMGLMTRHILHGQIPTFLWGVAYCGPQEALLAAPGFAVFGSSWLALRLVPMALTAVTAVLVWRVGRRTIGNTAAIAAGCCAWVWPAHVLFETTREVGFYAINATYCSLILLLALRVVERPDLTRTAIFGLVLGLAQLRPADRDARPVQHRPRLHGLLIAYVLDFDTRERIVGVENKFYTARLEHGQDVLPSDPYVHHATYQREVEAAPRRGFVFLRDELPSIQILPQLVRHGYRRVDVGTFVVYVPPAT